MTAKDIARSVVRRGAGVSRRVARRAVDTRAARRLRRPAISVIVPFYNVEAYLAECLDSILEQDVAHLEVILVDDGSPDGSRAIAERYVARDDRVRLVTRPNGGLGAARNTGVRESRGRYLTFIDSDDLLPPGALRALLETIEASGSDLVVGSVERFNAVSTWSPNWVRKVHDDRRIAITAEDFTPLLRNLYTWNKLFRREFWEAQDLWFREGVAYEDQPIITQLFARATAIDVIPDVVYRYRAREDQSSISQQTASLQDLRQRIEAWRVGRDVLTAEVSPALFEAWRLTLFDVHFHWYLTSTGTVDDDYWSELVAAVRELTEGAPDWVWEQTMPGRRVLIRLALLDRRADAQELVRQKGLRLDHWPARVRPDGILLELPFLGDPELEESLFLIRPEQLRIHHSVENLHWVHEADGSATARISGRAYLSKVDLAEHASRVSVVLREDGTGHERVFPADRATDSSYPPPEEDKWCDYSSGTFAAVIPMSEVVASAAQGTSWTVLLRVEAAGFTVTSRVNRLLRSGAAGVVPALTLRDGGRVVTEWQFNRALRLRVDLAGVRVTSARLEGRTVVGVLAADATDVRRVAAARPRHRVESAVADGRPQEFRIELPDAPTRSDGTTDEWRIEGWTADGDRVAFVPADDALPAYAGEELALETHRDGELVVRQWRLGAVADAAAVDAAGVLRVTGRTFGEPVTSIRLHVTSLRSRTAGPTVPVEGGRFVAQCDLRHEVYRFGAWPLPLGDHDLAVTLTTASGREATLPIRTSSVLSDSLPVPVQTDLLEGRVVRGPDAGVRVTLRRPIGEARGAYAQNQLRLHPPVTGGLTRGVLMRSYFGESATDNGLSIQRELQRRGSDLPVYWAVHDHSIVVPEGGIPVIVNSEEWYHLLASVTYYVDNMYQPEFHEKPAGQVLVQTFHGYPFKQMGHPHWRNTQFSQARIDAYDERASQWDYLVSPARYASPLLTRDFNYHGEVLEIGYPRNDVLNSELAPGIRAATRAALGIADHQTAVLYAPTFRDYMAVDDNRALMPEFLDFARFHERLGDDVVLLIRGHAFNARTLRRAGRVDGCVDVTDYPEISDLYLAADAAIVDYSSLRFDFGVTGKPMIFQVPDLQRYQDTRGWLFDFEPTAPGPLVSTTDEVVDCLLDLDRVRAEHAAAYDLFRQDYLDLEDGRAGARFVDAVFVPRGDAPPAD
ncbi:CDP-glycerol glycerophosphotransferase family protein [Nocardioides sp. KIGAM211]|uniref:CDP-glycerol glycerophosphotransferase family protein n=1 Tax=Nocardioides luti TaxID=2761101 RepID=A0A7X0RHH7_9ACTN|nr:CDP-glycerol glycerophosphotransferase family protein [Nocardioides luti]MBB6627440.1 CDP-glycerol glycerophosphotransferase family protein [Nocardioides luti]